MSGKFASDKGTRIALYAVIGFILFVLYVLMCGAMYFLRLNGTI